MIDWLKNHSKFRDDLSGYMNRWWIFKNKNKESWNIRLHEILRSDDDRCLHDHPWDYITIILKGGYFEITEDKEGDEVCNWRGPGSILFRRAKSRHRLIISDNANSTTTLFINGPKYREWGFWEGNGNNKKFIHWQDYEKVLTS